MTTAVTRRSVSFNRPSGRISTGIRVLYGLIPADRRTLDHFLAYERFEPISEDKERRTCTVKPFSGARPSTSSRFIPLNLDELDPYISRGRADSRTICYEKRVRHAKLMDVGCGKWESSSLARWPSSALPHLHIGCILFKLSEITRPGSVVLLLE